jgi:Ca-activated chloride channel family protein
MVGAYARPGPVTVSVSGKVGERLRTFKVRGSLTQADREHEFIPVVWASRKIGYLLDEVRLHGEKKELVDEIIRLSKEFGIMTEFTAFLVTEPNVTLAEANRRVTDAFTDSRRERTGSWALGQSQNAARLKTAPAPQASAGAKGGYYQYGATAGPAGPVGSTNYTYLDSVGRVQAVQNVQNVGRRAFVQQGQVWVDQDVKPHLPVVAIQNYSRAYFQLASASADARRYLAVGDEVKFVLNNQTVVVGPEGKTELTDKELRALVEEPSPSARRGSGDRDVALAGLALGSSGPGGGLTRLAWWAVPFVLIWPAWSAARPRIRRLLRAEQAPADAAPRNT